MSGRVRIVFWVTGLLLVSAGPAAANLCTGKYIEAVHRTEARELRSRSYSSGSSCIAGSDTCWTGTEDYDAMVIACNRKRDVRPFGVGVIKDLPLLHGPAGKTLDNRTAAQRRFADDLEPRGVTGQIQYFGMFPKWYGYVLERQGGDWIATSIIRFKFPNAEKKKLHLPAYLAARLSNRQGGRPLTETTCRSTSSGKNDNGMIREDWGARDVDRACRIDRDAILFLVDDGDRTDLDYIDETLGFTQARPARHWIMYYWRAVVETVWSRPDGSFQMKVEIANLAGRDGEISRDELDIYEKADLVFEMEFHHREGRANNMYRPIEVAGVKIYKATYTGLWPTGVAHEFGHSLGLDDEYPDSCDPERDTPWICDGKPNKDCQRLSGFVTGVSNTNDELAYAMCDEWDFAGTLEYPDLIQPHTVKSVYPWIVTQRYSIGEEIAECDEDSDCAGDEWCKRPVLGLNTCQPKLADGATCSRPKQCASGMCPAPDFKCAECTSNSHCASNEYCKIGTAGIGANTCEPKKANGAGCSGPAQCQSGLCPAPDFKCAECTSNSHCASNEYCKIGTAGIGANTCEPKKANGAGCSGPAQCQSGLCPAPDFKCSECTNDGHCDGDEYCLEGTLGIGSNACRAKKRDGLSCTRPAQCQSGLCPAPDFKCAECTSNSHCSSDEYCKVGTAGIGANTCEPKKANGASCSGPAQCQSGLCPAPDFKCAECTSDGHCNGNQYCDTGTLGVGQNRCRTKKSLGSSCSRGNQCSSGCCKLHNFKVQCRPSDKC